MSRETKFNPELEAMGTLFPGHPGLIPLPFSILNFQLYPLPRIFAISHFRISDIGSRISVLGSRLPILGSRISDFGSRLPIPQSRVTLNEVKTYFQLYPLPRFVAKSLSRSFPPSPVSRFPIFTLSPLHPFAPSLPRFVAPSQFRISVLGSRISDLGFRFTDSPSINLHHLPFLSS